MIDAPLVVVGVDGSDCSREALRFAVNEAQMRGARLAIVTAWSVPTMTYAAGFAPGIDPGTFQQAAASVSTDAVKAAHEIAPDLEVDAATPEAHPAAALLSAAEKADLLVVGSRVTEASHACYSGLSASNSRSTRPARSPSSTPRRETLASVVVPPRVKAGEGGSDRQFREPMRRLLTCRSRVVAFSTSSRSMPAGGVW
jgi:nucleotide-binding universal stress UspA family protein